jgi:hypothetical protein
MTRHPVTTSNKTAHIVYVHLYLKDVRAANRKSRLLAFAWGLLGPSFLLVQLISDSTVYG